MKDNNFKKVLLFGQAFNNFTGGGITLSNLFRGWPKDKIALMTTEERLQGLDTAKCNNVYLIGNLETKRIFPFNLLKKDIESVHVRGSEIINKKLDQIKNKKTTIKEILFKALNRALIFLGFKHFGLRFNVSNSLLSFIKDFSPDYIYTQAGSLAAIDFVNKLHNSLSIPIIIHIMDDHMASHFNDGIYVKLFGSPASLPFQALANNAAIKIGICKEMAREYERRYGGSWEYFHNSVDVSRWTINCKTIEKDADVFKVFYVGKAIFNNASSLIDFAKAVHKLALSGNKVELHLYIVRAKNSFLKKMSNLCNVYCHPPVNHEEVPDLIHQFDLLLLPLAFTKKAYQYAKYSMPTKMPEYMISGIPTLVFAPNGSAVTKYAKKTNVAFTCSDNKHKILVNCLKEIISDQEKRKKIAANAINVAKVYHDMQKENIRFRNLLNNCGSQRNTHFS